MLVRFLQFVLIILLTPFLGMSQTVYSVLVDSASIDGSDMEMPSADVVFSGYPENYIVDSILVKASVGDDCSDYYSLTITLNDTEKFEQVCNGTYRLVENIPLNNLKISAIANDEDEDDDWITVKNITTVYFHYPKPVHDIAMLQFMAPLSACGLSDTEHLVVQLANNGHDTETYIPLVYSVDNAQHWKADTIHDTIFPNDTLLYEITTPVDFSHYGRYECFVAVDYSLDTIHFNDTLYSRIENKRIVGDDIPFYESFDAEFDFPSGWESYSTRIYHWHIHSGPTTSTNTGPAEDHTSGHGNYAYIEASDGFEGDTTWLVSPCLSLDTVASSLRLSFWYHMYGSGVSQLFTEVLIDTEWVCIDTIDGAQQSNSEDAWKNRRLNISKDITKIRFWSYVKSNTDRIYGDIAIDDIRIERIFPHDLQVVAMDYRKDICSGSDSMAITIVNVGEQSETDFSVSYSVDGGLSFTTETVSMTLSPNDSLKYSFANLPTLSEGAYAVMGAVSLSGDGNLQNDTMLFDSIFVSPQVTVFPYYQDFESTQHWYAQGKNSSWQLGTPSTAFIDAAASGTKAWVTNLSGDYSANEYSQLTSPCFDFSSLQKPMIEFDCFVQTETYWDGVQLQYSTDGKQWHQVGEYGDWEHWYNDDDVNAIGSDDNAGWSGRTNHWMRVRHTLDFLAGKPMVKFRFLFASDNDTQDEGVAIDNISLHDYTDLAVIYPEDSALYCGLNTSFEIHLQNTGNTVIPKNDTVLVYYAVDTDTVGEKLILENNLSVGDSVVYIFAQSYAFPKDTMYQYAVWASYAHDEIDYNDTVQLHLAHYSLHLDLGGDTLYTDFPDTIELTVDTNYDAYVWNVPDTNDYHLGINDYGVYSIQVKDTNGCYLSGTIVITEPVSVSVLPNPLWKCEAYPNPVRETVTIESNVTIRSVQVWDMHGRLQSVKITRQRHLCYIDLKALPHGIYLVQMKSDYGRKVLKVVKQ